MRTIFALMVLCSPALAGGDTPQSPWLTESQSGWTIGRPQFLTISCGKGSVSVSMDDGSVKFEGGCTPDDSAKSFWEAIRAMYGVGCPAIKP
jgi:hypothetical protein